MRPRSNQRLLSTVYDQVVIVGHIRRTKIGGGIARQPFDDVEYGRILVYGEGQRRGLHHLGIARGIIQEGL